MSPIHSVLGESDIGWLRFGDVKTRTVGPKTKEIDSRRTVTVGSAVSGSELPTVKIELQSE